MSYNCRCNPCVCPPVPPILVTIAPAADAAPVTIDRTQFFDTTLAPFIMPASSATVNIEVVDGTRYAAGGWLYINEAGWFEIMSVADATHAQIKNNGTDGNLAAGNTVSSGKNVFAGMPPITEGATPEALRLSDFLTAGFTMPAASTPTTITTTDTSWARAGMIIFVANAGRFTIQVVSNSTQLSIMHTDITTMLVAQGVFVGAGQWVIIMDRITAQTITQAEAPTLIANGSTSQSNVVISTTDVDFGNVANGSGSYVSVAVVFDTPFASAPRLFWSFLTWAGSADTNENDPYHIVVDFTNLTTTGVTMRCKQRAGETRAVKISLLAIGEKA